MPSTPMSNEQKMLVNFYSTIITRAILTILATLASIVFWDIRNNITEIKGDVKTVTNSLLEVDKRLIKVETKLDDSAKKIR